MILCVFLNLFPKLLSLSKGILQLHQFRSLHCCTIHHHRPLTLLSTLLIKFTLKQYTCIIWFFPISHHSALLLMLLFLCYKLLHQSLIPLIQLSNSHLPICLLFTSLLYQFLHLFYINFLHPFNASLSLTSSNAAGTSSSTCFTLKVPNN